MLYNFRFRMYYRSFNYSHILTSSNWIRTALVGAGQAFSQLQVFHTLRQQRLKRVQTVRLCVHALRQRVAQMHLVLQQQPRRW